MKGTSAANRRQGRRWRFASALLDEDSWTLSVAGERVAIEAKPLELLHELLLHAGKAVTKDELLDTVWHDLSVVEASLPTAVLKLRRVLGDDSRSSRIIETVPRIGYRIAVPVECDTAPPNTNDGARSISVTQSPRQKGGSLRWPLVAGGAAVMLAASAFIATQAPHASDAPGQPQFTQRDARDAIRRLDQDRIEQLLRAGWNPNTPFDNEGNGALNVLMGVCEWDVDHDRHRLTVIARTLIDAGARLDVRNVWGDTPYSIAKAKRYCGPDHPVTKMLHTACYSDLKPIGAACEAKYPPKKS